MRVEDPRKQAQLDKPKGPVLVVISVTEMVADKPSNLSPLWSSNSVVPLRIRTVVAAITQEIPTQRPLLQPMLCLLEADQVFLSMEVWSAAGHSAPILSRLRSSSRPRQLAKRITILSLSRGPVIPAVVQPWVTALRLHQPNPKRYPCLQQIQSTSRRLLLHHRTSCKIKTNRLSPIMLTRSIVFHRWTKHPL